MTSNDNAKSNPDLNAELKLNLIIANEHLHHHAKYIIGGNPDFAERLTTALSNPIKIYSNSGLKKKRNVTRISAGPLNAAIRELLNNELPEIRTEVFDLDGVYYEGESTHGFDFAFIDEKQNLSNLWNLCHGTRPYSNGNKRWEDYLVKNPRISEIAAEYNKSRTAGNDVHEEKASPIILGEIQFGNWGLVYRDFFKVIKANIYTDVDLLVYITATGKLEKMLSDGIVGFKKTREFLKENAKVVTIPTWIIALDTD